MKRPVYMIAALLITAGMLLTSCSDDVNSTLPPPTTTAPPVYADDVTDTVTVTIALPPCENASKDIVLDGNVITRQIECRDAFEVTLTPLMQPDKILG